MNRRTRAVLTVSGLVVVAAGAATTASLLTSSGAWSSARRQPAKMGAYLILVCLTTVLSLTIRWVRWTNLVRRCDARVPTRDGAKLYAATLPAIVTPFYVGELVRAVVLSRRFPGRGGAFGLVWGLERLGDLMAATILWCAFSHQIWTIPIIVVAWIIIHTAATTLLGGGSDHSLGAPGALGITLGTSVAAWLLPGLGLAAVARGFGSRHAIAGLAAVFYRSTVLGGLTGLPLGIVVTGVLLVNGLRHLALSPGGSALAVATFRAGTSWFALTLGLVALAMYYRSLSGLLVPAEATSAPHFEAIGSEYAEQLPAFVRDRLIRRKVGLITSGQRRVPGLRGLELGCGHGWYAAELAGRGYVMTACDVAHAQVAEAAQTARFAGVSLGLSVADGARLPYADNSFAFVYAINVVHHILDPVNRARTLDEVVRVLEPGGVFYLQEMNTVNPLFRFHLGYLYPLLHRIDEGTELWIHPRRLPHVPGANWSAGIDYLTFLPEFAPPAVVRVLERLERRLERSRLRTWSAHYSAQLVKHPARVAEASVI